MIYCLWIKLHSTVELRAFLEYGRHNNGIFKFHMQAMK